MDEMPSTVFVYGTLKRGERRERAWPSSPLSVKPAIVRGVLFDLIGYPALRPGEGYVLGECWEVSPNDLAETLRVLDEIECFSNHADDLYYRDVVECKLLDGSVQLAHTYIFAQVDRLENRVPMPSDPNRPAQWTSRSPPI